MTSLRNTRYGAETPGTLAHAWRRASQEFGFRAHEIVVSRIEPEGEAVPAARRLVKDRRWTYEGGHL